MQPRLWTSIVLAALLLDSAGALASEALLTDPAGDAVSANQVVPYAPAVADLLSMSLAEEDNQLVFVLKTSAPGPLPGATEPVTYVTEFSYRSQRYAIVSDLGESLSGQLMKLSPQTGQFESLQAINTTFTAGEVTQFIPGELIVDSVGLPLFRGQYLQDIYVRVYSGFEPSDVFPPQGPGKVLYDQMPDQGLGAYEIQSAVETDFPFVLQTENPVRFSNGGAGTFVFPIQAFNAQTTSGSLRFTILETPPQWTVGLIHEILEVPPQSALGTGVVVQTPFGHSHGETGNVTAEVLAIESGRKTTLQFQVVYAEVPQPAGHHPTVFMHSARRPTFETNKLLENVGEYQSDLYMNTLSEDKADEGVAVNHQTHGSTQGWWVPLKPDLAMGLRTDPEKVGQLQFDIEPSIDAAFENVRISGELRVVSGDSAKTVATLTEWTASTVSSKTAVSLEVRPTEQTVFDFHSGQALELFVSLQGVSPVPQSNDVFLNWLPGGKMEIPLLEYGDPIPPSALQSPIQVPQEVNLDVSPGKFFLAEIPVTNAGTEAIKIELAAVAARPEWGLAIDPKEVQVAAGKTATVTVSGIAPASSVTGDRLQIPLTVKHDAQGGTPVVGLVLNFVDEAPDYQQASEKAPGWGAGAAMALLFIAAISCRRRA